MENSGSDDEPDIVVDPMTQMTVFFCKHCKSVVTDSSAIVATCTSLDMIIHNGVTGLVKEGPSSWKELLDRDYLCKSLQCICGAEFGMCLGELAPPYQSLSGCYASYSGMLSCYTLGDLPKRSEGYSGQKFGPPLPTSDTTSDLDNDGHFGQLDANPNLGQTVDDLKEDLHKVKSMVLFLHQAMSHANLLPHQEE